MRPGTLGTSSSLSDGKWTEQLKTFGSGEMCSGGMCADMATPVMKEWEM